MHFKGSGFYNTDYGTRKRSREMKEAEEGSTSETSKDGGKKSESAVDSSDSNSDSGAKKTETKAAKTSSD